MRMLEKFPNIVSSIARVMLIKIHELSVTQMLAKAWMVSRSVDLERAFVANSTDEVIARVLLNCPY